MVGGAAAGGCQEQTAGLWSVDTDGSSTMPGLYSAGDCCATWMWGAIIQGPPPGLSPAGITGKRSAQAAQHYIQGSARPDLTEEDFAPGLVHLEHYRQRKSGFDPRWVTQLLQNYSMPYYILHIKEKERLEATLTLVRYLEEHMIPLMRAEDPHMLRLAHETENMALNAEMTLRASLFRTESRGWHFREDFPKPNDEEWLAWNQIRRGADGGMVLNKVPVPEQWRPEGPSVTKPTWLAWEHP
jgi:succinate dehydrogenase/fumarate reductase flavoprotein subunit